MHKILVATVLTASLLGCAQSGSAPASPVVAGKTAAANTTTADSGEGRCGIARFEAAAAAKLNAYRSAGARCGSAGSFASSPPLTWNGPLGRAALLHTQDMARHGYFDHQGRDGRDASQRVDAAGYDWSSTSENIALGARSLDEVMAMWINSPGHCANMMAPEPRDFGLACVARPGGQPYWTLVLGRAR